MAASPLLSVIVVNYNNGQYLDECLESIVAQSFNDLEVVVVDDGSTDNSPETILAWASRRVGVIRPFFRPDNRGVTAARILAAENSRGRFLTTLDADDFYVDRGKLEREMALIQRQEAVGETCLAFSDIALVRVDGSPICRVSEYLPLREGHLLEPLLSRACLIPRDFIVPQEAFRAVGGYDPLIPIYEDWDLKTRLAARWPYRFSGGGGTAYRQHGRGFAAWPWDSHLAWLNYIFRKNLPLAPTERRAPIQAAFARFLAEVKPPRQSGSSG